jgi:DNA excision repair protein ERCC-3
LGEEPKIGIAELNQDRLKFLLGELLNVIPYVKELGGMTEEARKAVEREVADFALSIKTSKLDKDQLEAFFKKPYYLEPVHGRPDSWYLIIPKFVDIQIGWMDRSTESYNRFLINRYMDWLGEIPEAIKRQLNWKTPPELTLDGEEIHGPKGALDYAWQKYRPFLHDRDEKAIHVNPKRAFDLIASMIKDGVLPFNIRPVDPADLATSRKCDFQLRDYQTHAWDELNRFSAIGVFYPPSTGKTFIGLWVMTHLKPPNLIVVPTRLLQEQWIERIQTHTDLQPGEYEVMTYQGAITKASAKQWTTMIVDETHHLPANTFVKLALLKRKYTVGLSATPFREDGREEYVFALTGKPIGLSWDYFKKLNLIKSPTCNVWIVKNFEAKLKRLGTLLQVDLRTIIFSDALEVGKTVAARFSKPGAQIPFVSGATKDNMNTILNNRVVVVSRVGDEGMSLPDIERVIEVSWLGGSRRQELQRTTRLLHSQTEDQAMHILMTLEEYLRDRKRLFSIMDKGFKIVLHREGVSEKIIEDHSQDYRPSTPRARQSSRQGELPPGPPGGPPSGPPQPLQSGQSATYMALPGVQKIMAMMNKKQQQFYKILLDHDGEWFSRKQLPMLLGYSGDTGTFQSTLDFPRLVERQWIEQKREGNRLSYRTNMKGKMGV